MSIFETLKRPSPAPTFPEAVEQARVALAALDFSEENNQVEAIDAEIARIGDAIDQARQRAAQLGNEEAEARSSVRDVANALMDGGDPDAATTTSRIGSLAERKAAMLGAIPELAQRRTDAVMRRGQVITAVDRRIAEAAQPLVDALRSQAEEAAERLVELYADLSMLSAVTTAGSQVARQVSYVAAEITAERLLIPRRGYAVSEAIRSLQPALEGKGAVFPHKYPIKAEVGPPQGHLPPQMPAAR